MVKPANSSGRNFLQSVFKVQPGEVARLWLLLLYCAAFGGGVITVGYRGVGSALFLSRLPASATPYLFILPAVAITVFLLVYNRLAARIKSTPLVLGSTAFLIMLCLLFRLLLETEYATSFALLASIYLLTEAAMSLVGIQIWAIAGQIFDAREARRIFPLAAAGGTVASIVAGLSLGPLASLLGVNNLVLVLAFTLGVCGLAAWLLSRQERISTAVSTMNSSAEPAHQGAARKVDVPGSFLQTLRAMWRTPLLRAIGALTVLMSLIINIGAYQFFLALQVNFAGQDEAMVSFLGGFEVWTGLFALAVQFLVTPYVIRRFGLFVGLFFFPLATVLTSGAALAAGGMLISIAAIRALDPALRWTINDVAFNLLYLPVPAGLRQRAKELYGGLYAAVFGVLGLLFLAAEWWGGVAYVYWSVPAVGFALVWAGMLHWTRRHYLQKLAENVTRRRFDIQGTPLQFTDPDTVRVLAATLRNDDELQVLHALELINKDTGINWDQYVAPLLKHRSPAVRVQALLHLGRPGNVEYTEEVTSHLHAPEEEVCVAAVEAICAIEGPASVKFIESFLIEDPSFSQMAAAKGAAVLGFVRYGGSGIMQRVTATLREMVESSDSAMRQAGARVLAELAVPDFQPLLLSLMDDPDPSVRIRAVQAAGRLRSVALIPHLLSKLGDKIANSAAIEALACYGDLALPGLAAALRYQYDTGIGRREVPVVLLKIGTAQAAEILLANLSHEDGAVRAEVFKALAALRIEGVVGAVSETRLTERLLLELNDCYRLYVIREDVSKDLEDLLLHDALTLKLRRTLDGILELLIVHYDGTRMQLIREALHTDGAGNRAQAIELLDNVASTQIRDLFIPLIEAPSAQVLDLARKKFSLVSRPADALLRDLAAGSDPWLRVCAIWRLHDGHVDAATTGYQSDGVTSREEIEMLLSTVERVLILKRVPLFAGIPGEELAGIAQLAEEVRFSSGETMIRQGELADCLYVTVDGQTGIMVEGVGQVAVRDAPTVLGEMGLILQQPRSAGCVALSDVITLKIGREPFQELLAQEHGIALQLIKVLAVRLEQAQSGTQN